MGVQQSSEQHQGSPHESGSGEGHPELPGSPWGKLEDERQWPFAFLSQQLSHGGLQGKALYGPGLQQSDVQMTSSQSYWLTDTSTTRIRRVAADDTADPLKRTPACCLGRSDKATVAHTTGELRRTFSATRDDVARGCHSRESASDFNESYTILVITQCAAAHELSTPCRAVNMGI